MAQLGDLGQPFGSAHQIINLPAPGPAFPGLDRGVENLASALIQRGQSKLEDQDRQALAALGNLPPGQLSDEQTSKSFADAIGNFQSKKFKGIADAIFAQQLAKQADPTGQQQREATLGKTLAETEKLGRPDVVSPTQQIAQQKLNRIKQLQAIPEDERTPGQTKSLKRLIEGQSAVQINFPKPAAASERTAIAETNASLDALANLETLFESPSTETGPIKGRISPFAGLVGFTTDEQENLMAATAAFKNKVIKDITGAQMSEPEAKRIMKQIPDITDPPARWKAKKNQTEKNLRTIQKRRIQVLQQSGLAAPGGNIQSQQQVQPSRESLTPADLSNLTLEQLQNL